MFISLIMILYIYITLSQKPIPTVEVSMAPPPVITSVAPSLKETSVQGDGPLLVVKDYVRQGKKRARGDLGMQKCPITGQMVPTEKFTEHLRIVLLDPKWK